MKKIFFYFLFLSFLPLCVNAQRVCKEWAVDTSYRTPYIKCISWDSPPVYVKPVKCEWKTVKDSFGNQVQQCFPVTEQERPLTCKIWKTAILKNGSRQSYCTQWLYQDAPSSNRIICREFVSLPLTEKLTKKQKEAWLSECSNFEIEADGKLCLVWKHQYQPDDRIITRCSTYQPDSEKGLPISIWTDYIGADSDLKPVASLTEYYAKKEKYPCKEYKGSKMDKKKGTYIVSCTRFASEDTLPSAPSASKSASKTGEVKITLPLKPD